MEINQYITKKLLEANKKIKNLTKSKNKATNRMIDYMLLQKGKQLRLRFMLATAFYFDSDNDISEYAAMIELMQMAETVHDEVINKTNCRRNEVTVSEKFGTESAVYLGDYIIFSLFTKMDLDIQVRKMILDGLSDIYEMRNNKKLFDFSISCNEYITNITGKTAGYYGLSMKLAAFLGGAKTEKMEMFETIGIIYGILLQINDDLIEIFSLTNDTGKSLFYNFSNGVYTLPLIMAKTDRTACREILKIQTMVKKYGMTDEDKDILLGILRETNALDKTCDIAKDFYEKGVVRIKQLDEGGAKAFFLSYYDKMYKSIENKCKKRILEV